MGHYDLAEDGVAEGYGVVGDIEDGDAMVEHKGVSYDGEGDFFIAKLGDGIEVADTAIEAFGGIAVLDGLIEAPGHSSGDGACVGKDGEFAFLGWQAETTKCGDGGGGAAGVVGGLRADVVGIETGLDIRKIFLEQSGYKEGENGAVNDDGGDDGEDDDFFDAVSEPAQEGR